MKAIASNQSRLLYEFGPFQLDPSERLLSRVGEVITLTPKAFDTLVALVENSGRLLEKEYLLRTVWPDTFVDENTIASNISALRKALGQSNGDQYIETVPKRGYRFVASVRELHLEAGDLLVQKHTRSSILIKQEQDDFAKSTLSSKSKTVLVALILLSAATVTAFVWEANRKAARAVTASREEAREAYVEGRSLWNTRTGEGVFKSISYFEQAISKDPGFPLGYAGLADAYAFDYEHWGQSEAMARKAIELDGNLAEPHATLGFIKMFWQWNRPDAERELKRAIELNPDYATAHQWYAICLASHLQGHGASVEMQEALALDPTSLPIRADMAQMYYLAHEYDRAIEACKQVLDVSPGFLNAHKYLYQAYTGMEMYTEAVDEFFKYQSLAGDGLYNDPINVTALRKAYAADGIRGFWKANLNMLLKQSGGDPYTTAEYYALLGDKDHALDSLERAYDWHNFDLVFLNVNPVFSSLRAEPRFRDLVRRMGLGPPDNYR